MLNLVLFEGRQRCQSVFLSLGKVELHAAITASPLGTQASLSHTALTLIFKLYFGVGEEAELVHHHVGGHLVVRVCGERGDVRHAVGMIFHVKTCNCE